MFNPFKKLSPITEDQALDALRNVALPGQQSDVVSAGMVDGLTLQPVEGGQKAGLLLKIERGREAGMEEVRQACERTLLSLPGIKQATVVLTAQSAPQPLNQHQQAAQQRGEKQVQAQWNRTPLPGVSRIIAIASGKGGVGKSTTTVMLAHALRAAGHPVGVLDADIYGPSIPRMLGLSGTPEVKDGKMQPLTAHGIACNSMGFIMPQAGAVVWRGPMLTKALHQLARGTDWASQSSESGVRSSVTPDSSSSDLIRGSHAAEAPEATPSAGITLLIDLPPGTGDVQLSLAQQVPLTGAIIVTTPQEVAVQDAIKAADMFGKVDVPILGIIENMSGFTDPGGTVHHLFGIGGGQRLADRFAAPLLATIPLQSDLGQLLDTGQPPRGEHLAAYAGVVEKL